MSSMALYSYFFTFPECFYVFSIISIRGEWAPIFNSIMPYFLVVIAIILIKGTYDTFRKYEAKTKELDKDLKAMIHDMES